MDFHYNVYTLYGRPGGSVGDLDTFWRLDVVSSNLGAVRRNWDFSSTYRSQIARAAGGIAPVVGSESGVIERCVDGDCGRDVDIRVRTDCRYDIRAQKKTL